jgi:Ca-activated chloride channel family protein
LAALGDPKRVLQQLSGDSLRIFRWRVVLLLIAISGMIFSAAGPRLSTEGDSDTTAVDVMVLLDISESMLVADVAPSRLLVAKSFIRKLEARLSEYRIGLTLLAFHLYRRRFRWTGLFSWSR